MIQTPKSVLIFNNGCIAVLDTEGKQIPELQRSIPDLWASHAESIGYKPDGLVMENHGGNKFRLVKTSQGWNWDLI